MTDTPDKPNPPKPTDAGDGRADALIDAVVNDDTPAPPPAEPASAGGRTSDKPSESGTKENASQKEKQEKEKPTTFGGKLWHGWIKPIGTVFIVVALVRSTIIDWNDVPTGSMEPTILVGDRILVNKMAYALQAPLSGPKIGVPFTPLQWDNPLDGLPAWHWGNPRRGDIVTFWNPVTGIRMVKRIVAEPGDTIELRGGVLTITPRDGTPTTATYTDNTPAPPHNLAVVGQTAMGGEDKKEVEWREETLLGEVRMTQHILDRSIADWALYRFENGKEGVVRNGRVPTPNGQTIPVEAWLAQQPSPPVLHLAIRDGAPYIGDQPVSYNAFAEQYLAPLAGVGPVKIDGQTLSVDGRTWVIDGEPASINQAAQLLARGGQAGLGEDARKYAARYQLLRDLLMTSFGPVTVGDNEYFMVGDNRNNSTDSRFFGTIQRSEITGEAIAIPVSFHGRIRDLKPHWSRWFKGLD